MHAYNLVPSPSPPWHLMPDTQPAFAGFFYLCSLYIQKMLKAKCVVRKSNELTAFSVDCADIKQARAFVRAAMPDCYLVSVKPIAWELPVHFDFVLCSHTVSIAKHSADRRRRGVVGLPTMELA